VKNWVKSVARSVLELGEDADPDAGGAVFLSGSHILGIHDPGADIDAVCVVLPENDQNENES